MDLELLREPARSLPSRGNILFLHGVYHAAWCWADFMLPFAEAGFECAALSLRGHGGSGGREAIKRAGFNEFLEDVRVTAAGIGRPLILIGHSLGGMLIQKYVETYSAAAAVLISTPTPTTMRTAGAGLLRAFPGPMLSFLVRRDPDRFYRRPEVLRALFFSERIPEDVLRPIVERLMDQRESWRLFLDVSFLRFRPPAKALPVLVLGGEADFTIRPDHFRETAARYGTSPVILPGRPHDLMLEPGWQDAAAFVLDWLRDQGL